jgi:CDP-glucose 4,6-dehydratase
MTSPSQINEALNGRNVLVTGHTGFTGSWLCYWLSKIGCAVTGVALMPHTNPSLFNDAAIANMLDSRIGDVRDLEFIKRVISESQPSLVIHLAAQTIVHRSYKDPIETFQTNIIGTTNLLEATRNSDSVKAFLNVTTDKVYRNQEWARPYNEIDELGGKDPYSVSKACSDLISSSYRETMTELSNGMAIGVVRSGNIIGGGDWSEERIVPDFYRATINNIPLEIRNPSAVRPWQHVISACHAYLSVATYLLRANNERVLLPIWNVGPSDKNSVTVRKLVDLLSKISNKPPEIVINEPKYVETSSLLLNSKKIENEFDFFSPWNIFKVVEETAFWYEESLHKEVDAADLMQLNFEEYLRDYESYRNTNSVV